MTIGRFSVDDVSIILYVYIPAESSEVSDAANSNAYSPDVPSLALTVFVMTAVPLTVAATVSINDDL